MSPTLNRQNSIRFYQILAVISESESTWNELSDGHMHGTQKFEHKIATFASFVMVHENCTEKHRILITQGLSSQTELDPWLSYHHKGNCKVSWNSNRGIWRKALMPWFTRPTIAAALPGSMRWKLSKMLNMWSVSYNIPTLHSNGQMKAGLRWPTPLLSSLQPRPLHHSIGVKLKCWHVINCCLTSTTSREHTCFLPAWYQQSRV